MRANGTARRVGHFSGPRGARGPGRNPRILGFRSSFGSSQSRARNPKKGNATPNPNSTGNPKFGGSAPVRGPRGARIRTRLTAQCRLHQISAPQNDSSPLLCPSGEVKISIGREVVQSNGQTALALRKKYFFYVESRFPNKHASLCSFAF